MLKKIYKNGFLKTRSKNGKAKSGRQSFSEGRVGGGKKQILRFSLEGVYEKYPPSE